MRTVIKNKSPQPDYVVIEKCAEIAKTYEDVKTLSVVCNIDKTPITIAFKKNIYTQVFRVTDRAM